MIAIVCVDQKNGMMFNNRRQSQDRKVRENILEMTGDKPLWMNEYSYAQFKDEEGKFSANNEFLSVAGKDDYCFIENVEIPEEKAIKLVVYRWDKTYPSDFSLNIDLDSWTLKSTLEFMGYSHEKITKEEYEK